MSDVFSGPEAALCVDGVLEGGAAPLALMDLATPLLPETSPSATADSAETAQPVSGFSRFGLRPELLTALDGLGFHTPSPIQKAAIPELMLGRDLVGQARTGTGKTAAFGLPLLHGLDPAQSRPQVLVLTPTRELALQVAEALASFSSALPRVRVLALYGGADFREQMLQLRCGVQVVVGTPGRVMDHMRQGTLDLSALTTLVLDEADEMLRMGFIESVEWVLEQLPAERQVVLLSATMPSAIRRLSNRYLRNPAEITIHSRKGEESRIQQRWLMVQAQQKPEALQRVLEAEGQGGVIIFTRTKAVSLTLAEALEREGHNVALLNGDVPQAQRERTIQRLRDGRLDVLVATDVAARGLDVDRIALVINYDMPFDGEAYVHRIGRTGRAGRSGQAILFLTPREKRFLSELERAVGETIRPMEVPSNASINQARLNRLEASLTALLADTPLSETEQALIGELLQRVGREQEADPKQLTLAALALALRGKPLLLNEQEPSPVAVPMDAASRRRAPRSAPAPRSESDDGPEAHMERFRLEVGWRDRVRPGNIVGAIANEGGLTGKSIGKIRIYDCHTTIDLPRNIPADVVANLQRLRVMNKELQLSRL
ncbi:MAG: DEAD/DEAH box helicase [Cyanobacteria bacterium K_Offshore_surface_m2_239]|nr:DEAD/DEAH box helicase [Cyanobacteria bacterium K_Offshore_surface_m2_239]